MYQITKLYQHYLLSVKHLENIKRSIFDFLFCLPSSLFALILLLLLVYNGFSVFYIHLPFPAKSSVVPPMLSLQTEKPFKKLPTSVMYAVKEENPSVVAKNTLSFLQKPEFSAKPRNHYMVLRSKKIRKRKAALRNLQDGDKTRQFSTVIKDFFEKSQCKVRFFMTWISSLQSFGEREYFSVESIFKSHPNACLAIVSNSMDSEKGNLLLKPFLDKGFKVIAIQPDYEYLFKNTCAQTWFNGLKKGHVNPGGVSLGQNLSNLLRLALLYKFGGIYIDTDVIVLKSFTKLRNVLGAQTIDTETGNWSRLNNAVLVFDKKHPLLFKFIQEFALTFDGNKWGHNGPYLVSRVVSRVNGRPGLKDFTVLHPSAFYPVNWSRVKSFFRGPKSNLHSKWLHNKLNQIRNESFALHLWNKHSRRIKVEDGSIIDHIMLDYCIFCNSSSHQSVI